MGDGKSQTYTRVNKSTDNKSGYDNDRGSEVAEQISHSGEHGITGAYANKAFFPYSAPEAVSSWYAVGVIIDIRFPILLVEAAPRRVLVESSLLAPAGILSYSWL